MKQTIKVQWRLEVGKKKYTSYENGFQLEDDFKKMSEETIDNLGKLLALSFGEKIKQIINPEYGTPKYYQEILEKHKRTKWGGSFKCPKCKYEAKLIEEIIVHDATTHGVSLTIAKLERKEKGIDWDLVDKIFKKHCETGKKSASRFGLGKGVKENG